MANSYSLVMSNTLGRFVVFDGLLTDALPDNKPKPNWKTTRTLTGRKHHQLHESTHRYAPVMSVSPHVGNTLTVPLPGAWVNSQGLARPIPTEGPPPRSGIGGAFLGVAASVETITDVFCTYWIDAPLKRNGLGLQLQSSEFRGFVRFLYTHLNIQFIVSFPYVTTYSH